MSRTYVVQLNKVFENGKFKAANLLIVGFPTFESATARLADMIKRGYKGRVVVALKEEVSHEEAQSRVG